jgi:hypothetical protein
MARQGDAAGPIEPPPTIAKRFTRQGKDAPSSYPLVAHRVISLRHGSWSLSGHSRPDNPPTLQGMGSRVIADTFRSDKFGEIGIISRHARERRARQVSPTARTTKRRRRYGAAEGLTQLVEENPGSAWTSASRLNGKDRVKHVGKRRLIARVRFGVVSGPPA